MLRRCLLPLVAGLALVASLALADTRLTFVHFNDIDQMGEAGGKGGVARLAAVVQAERAAKQHVVVTHGGDMISPSLLSGFDKGAHMVALMNAIGLDIMVTGNHEFDFGPEVLKQRLAEAKYVWLAGNVRENGAPLAGAVDTHMIEVGGYKVGFLGLVTAEAAFISSPGPTIQFAAVLDTAKALAAKLRADGASLVVAVAHLPLGQDRKLILDRTGVDIVLAGHDHIVYTEYDGGGLVVQAGSQGNYAAVVDVDLKTIESRGKTRFAWEPTVRFVRTDQVEPASGIAAMVKDYEDKLSAELDQPLGKTEVLLDSRRATIRGREAAIGNLIADAIRLAVDADVALTNGGGIRGDRAYEAGHTLTRRDILTELPFGNRTVKLQITGAELRAALEHGFSQHAEGAGRFPQISGMTVVWDPKAAVGARVLEVVIGGAALDPGKTYTLATNDFVAKGGDGYAVLARLPRLIDPDSAQLMAGQVMAYVTQQGKVAPKIDGRITTKE